MQGDRIVRHDPAAIGSDRSAIWCSDCGGSLTIPPGRGAQDSMRLIDHRRGCRYSIESQILDTLGRIESILERIESATSMM